jgi:hypothetical protein
VNRVGLATHFCVLFMSLASRFCRAHEIRAKAKRQSTKLGRVCSDEPKAGPVKSLLTKATVTSILDVNRKAIEGPPGPANYCRGTVRAWGLPLGATSTHQQDLPHARAFALAGAGDFVGHFWYRARRPALAVERPICSTSVCVIGIREIFVFEYQPQRLPPNWQQRSTQICDIARPGARRACYEEHTHTVRQRFPSRSLKPLPTHSRLRPHPARTD